MSKKGIFKFLTFTAISTAAAVGITYFTRYRAFHKGLEEDFHDFEDPDSLEAERNYVSLTPDNDILGEDSVTFVDKASQIAEATSDGVETAVDNIDELADTVSDHIDEFTDKVSEHASEFTDAAADHIGTLADKVSDHIDEFTNTASEVTKNFHPATTIEEDTTE